MKKKIISTITIVLVIALGILLYLKDNESTSTKNVKSSVNSTAMIIEKVPTDTELAESSKEKIKHNIIEKNQREVLKGKSEQEENGSKTHGINLEADVETLEKLFAKEEVTDYGWKSYWENELFVMLTNSATAYPFKSQKTECKSNTCKIEVMLSEVSGTFFKQTLLSLDNELVRRDMSLVIKSIGGVNKPFVFYVQPGSVK